MTRQQFEAIGGKITTIHRNPPETKFLDELPHGDRMLRARGASVDASITDVLRQREGM